MPTKNVLVSFSANEMVNHIVQDAACDLGVLDW